MILKGFDKFREKLPALKSFRILIIPLYCLLMVAAALALLLLFDSLPGIPASFGWNEIILSFSPLLGVLLVELVGFTLIFQIWFQRDRLKTAYGASSYQRIFLVGFGGVVMMLTLLIHQYLPFYSFSESFWRSAALGFLGTPLDRYLGPAALLVYILKGVCALFLLVLGLSLFVRAILTFGFDYMTVTYLYFPEESKIQRNEIYSALRHPAYAGAIMISLGGALFTFTVFSMVFFLIYIAGFWLHIHFVEERELVARFGDSYDKYRRSVPAFFVKPCAIGALFRFLFGGGVKKKRPNAAHRRSR